MQAAIIMVPPSAMVKTTRSEVEKVKSPLASEGSLVVLYTATMVELGRWMLASLWIPTGSGALTLSRSLGLHRGRSSSCGSFGACKERLMGTRPGINQEKQRNLSQ